MSSLSSAGLSFRRSQSEQDRFATRRPASSGVPPHSEPPPTHRSPVRYALDALALSVLFACAFVVALLLHLEAPSSRRAIAALISNAARVDVGSIDRISVSAIDVAEITLRDRSGRPVASAYGVRVRYDALSVARALLRRETPTIERTVIDRVNVALIPDDDAAAGALTPTSDGIEKRARLAIRAIDVGTFDVFGYAAGRWIAVHGEVENLSLQLGPDGATISAARIAIVVPPGIAPAETWVEVAGSVRVPTRVAEGELPVLVDRAEVHLASGGTLATITATGHEHSYEAHVEIPSIAPELLARLTGRSVAASAALSANLDVQGTRDVAEVFGVVAAGDGSATLDARVEVGALRETPSASRPRIALGESRVRVRGLELAMFGGPALSVSSDLVARATKTERGIELTIVADGDTLFDGRAAVVALDASVLIGANRALDASGSARATFGRAHVNVNFHRVERRLTATIAGSAPALEELVALHRAPLAGRVDVEGAVDLDLGDKTFAVDGRLGAMGFRHPSLAIPEGVIAVRGQGPFRAPTFVTTVVAKRLVLSPATDPMRLHDVDVHLVGTPKLVGVSGRLSTDAGQKLAVITHFAPTPTGARITGTKLHVERESFVAEIAVKDVTLAGSAVRVEGFRMSSTAGGLRLDGAYDPKRHQLSVDVASTPVDLPALMRGAGLEDLGLEGRLTVDAKIATIARRPSTQPEARVLRLDDEPRVTTATTPSTLPYLTGRVRLVLDDGYAPHLGHVSADVDVDVEDRLVAGDVALAVRDLFRIGLRGAVLLEGRLDDPRAWVDASAHFDFSATRIELATISSFLARRARFTALPTILAGLVDIEGHGERRGKNAPPTGSVNIATHGLGMVAGTTRIEGIDLRLRASLDGALDPSAPMQLRAVIEAHDFRGPIAVAHAGIEAAWAKLRDGGELSDAPLALDLIVLPRDFGLYPRALRTVLPVHGMLGVMGKGSGTLGAPKLELHARIEALSGITSGAHDVDLTLSYDGAVAKLMATVAARSAPTRKLFTLDGELEVRAADVFFTDDAVPWAGRVDAKLDDLPVELLVARSGVTGKARGSIHFDGDEKLARGEGRIEVDTLSVGGASFDETQLTLRVDERTATARAVVRGSDGRLDAALEVPLSWERAKFPRVAVGVPIVATLDAEELRLKLAEPFVPGVDGLDGKVNARIRARVTKGPDGHYDGAPSGVISLREGVIVVDELAERWEHVNADVKLEGNRLELAPFEFRGRAGSRATLRGNATFDDLTPSAFHLRLDVERGPFAQNRVKVGDFTGSIKVDGKLVPLPDGRDRLVIDLTLDPLAIQIADTTDRPTQALDDDPSITAKQPLGHRVLPAGTPGEGRPVSVAIHVPRPIWVRRHDVNVAVRGDPRIDIDGVADLGGEIRVEADPASTLIQPSWVDVSGKRFYLQASRIALEGHANFDPAIDIDARWQAPDRTIVQVRVTGRVRAPRIVFNALDERGAPLGLTRGAVTSLLALGRRDPGSLLIQREAEKGATLMAASLVSGVTDVIIGKELQKWLPAPMRVPFGTARESPGAAFEKVYLEIASDTAGTRLSAPVLGQSVPRKTFGIEWRFRRMWSLLVTIGDTGTTLFGLVWQYRY